MAAPRVHPREIPRIRVLHVIPDLAQGGAEAMLANLVRQRDPLEEHFVCTLLGTDDHAPVPVPVLRGGGRRGIPSPRLFYHVNRAVNAVRPDVIHSWMYHANLITASIRHSRVRTLWSIHNLSPEVGHTKSMTRFVNRVCSLLSPTVPDRIVYVAEASRHAHEAAGYAAHKGLVIPNGIDMDRFSPSQNRALLGERNGPTTLGMIARYDPRVKGHHFFIDVIAAYPLRDQIRLVFAGAGCDTSPQLRRHLEAAGLMDRVTLHGGVTDVETLYAGIDVLIVPSRSEALPLVVIEAAAMDVIVCASRVGDVPSLGLPDDLLFDVDDSDGLARAVHTAIVMARGPAQARATRRLVRYRFDIERISAMYSDLYQSMVRSGRVRGSTQTIAERSDPAWSKPCIGAKDQAS